MNLFYKAKEKTVTELNIYFQKESWAFPIFISWWGTEINRMPKARLKSFLYLNLYFLCFSIHFTWWEWR